MKTRSMIWVAAVALSAALLVTGCAGTAHIEKDKSADFSKYKTYAWAEKPESKEAKKARRNGLTETNIRNSVNAQLQKIGWKEVNKNPDIMVNYELLVDRTEKEQKDAVYSPSYTRSYYNQYTGRVNTYYYPGQFSGYDSYTTTVKEGTVTITMIDNRTDKAVWQGWTTSEIDSRKMTGKEIDQSVKTIFRKFDAGK
jgi:Domain of unknown function (DUF4136)